MKNFNKAQQQRGNALVYILIGVALFAALSVTFSNINRNQGGPTKQFDDAQIKLYVTELRRFSTYALGVVESMRTSGSPASSISALAEGEGGFDTEPHFHKILHPLGGAIAMPSARNEIFDSSLSSPDSGWIVSDTTNVEWTDSASDDIILTAYGINQQVCAKINEGITGNTSIPAIADATPTLDDLFAEDAGGSDFADSDCADCVGYFMLCVSNNAGDRFAYYTILVGR